MNLLYKILREFKEYFDTILCVFPGKLGYYLRYNIYKKRFKTCGNKISIPQSVFFKGFENIELGDKIWFCPYNSIFAESSTKEARIKIGNNVSFNYNVMVNADVKGEIIIEENALFGPNVVIRASGHRYENIGIPIREQGHHKGKIVIKSGAWIGANAVILPNVTVGRGAIVGAGAVVTKDVNKFEIVGGVPARRIGSLQEHRPENQEELEGKHLHET
jgi:galactoside O-acetyltransferase